MILLRRREDLDDGLGDEVRLDMLKLSGSKVRFDGEHVGPETPRLDQDSWSMSWDGTGARLDAFLGPDWVCIGDCEMGDAFSSPAYDLDVSRELACTDPREPIRGGLYGIMRIWSCSFRCCEAHCALRSAV